MTIVKHVDPSERSENLKPSPTETQSLSPKCSTVQGLGFGASGCYAL